MSRTDDDSPSDESKNYANLASDVKDIGSPDTQSATDTGSGTNQNVNEESEAEIKRQRFTKIQKLKMKTTIQQRMNLKCPRIDRVQVEAERGRVVSKGINTPSGNRGAGQ